MCYPYETTPPQDSLTTPDNFALDRLKLSQTLYYKLLTVIVKDEERKITSTNLLTRTATIQVTIDNIIMWGCPTGEGEERGTSNHCRQGHRLQYVIPNGFILRNVFYCMVLCSCMVYCSWYILPLNWFFLNRCTCTCMHSLFIIIEGKILYCIC